MKIKISQDGVNTKSYIIISTILIVIILVVYNIGLHGESEAIVKSSKITTIRMTNRRSEIKYINEKSLINKIVVRINNIKVTRLKTSHYDYIANEGYGVEITYDNGKKDSLIVLEPYLVHRGIWYKIDNNTIEDFREFYNDN